MENILAQHTRRPKAERNLAVGDATIAEREGEALAPATEVKDFGDKCILVHL